MGIKREQQIRVERRRAEVVRLYLIEHKPQAEIAQVYRVSQAVISKDLALMQDRWRQSALFDINQAKLHELQRIDAMEREYWLAWVESKTVKEISYSERQEEGVAPAAAENAIELLGKTKTKAGLRTTRREGNPAFLDGVRWAVEMRCKLLGLYEPSRVDITHQLTQAAIAAGLDPEEAIKEAQHWIDEGWK